MNLQELKHSKAFSLIELLVVIVVIGILAAVVVPNTIMAGDTARVAAAGEDLRAIEKAIEGYRNKTGKWPSNAGTAVLPTELESYFTKSNPFDKVTPIGGMYDYDGTSGTRGPLIKVVGTSGNAVVADATLLQLDEEMDDGDLSTGRIIKSSSQIHYFIVPADAP